MIDGDPYAVIDNEDGTVQVGIGSTFDLQGVKSPVIDGLQRLKTAFDQALAGVGPVPVPKRCAGVLFLEDKAAELAPHDKCDDGLVWNAGFSASNMRYWNSKGGTALPYNEYMVVGDVGYFPVK